VGLIPIDIRERLNRLERDLAVAHARIAQLAPDVAPVDTAPAVENVAPVTEVIE
jgi:hypothetical protein